MVEGSHLNMTWERVENPYVLSVQIARNVEMTSMIRTFVIPDCGGLSIDVGNGAWFFRVGSWYGTPQTGNVIWTAVYGPAVVSNPKLPVSVKPSAIAILHSQAIEHGIRIHTGRTSPYYVMADVSQSSDTIGASISFTQYAYDVGRGYVDIVGLDYAHIYSIRIATFAEEPSALPTDSIKPLSAALAIFGRRPARQLRKIESNLTTTARADATLLKDIARQPRLSFLSHSEYLKYVAAKAKTSEEIRPSTVGK